MIITPDELRSVALVPVNTAIDHSFESHPTQYESFAHFSMILMEEIEELWNAIKFQTTTEQWWEAAQVASCAARALFPDRSLCSFDEVWGILTKPRRVSHHPAFLMTSSEMRLKERFAVLRLYWKRLERELDDISLFRRPFMLTNVDTVQGVFIGASFILHHHKPSVVSDRRIVTHHTVKGAA